MKIGSIPLELQASAAILFVASSRLVQAFAPSTTTSPFRQLVVYHQTKLCAADEWTSDFDDFVGGEGEEESTSLDLAQLFQQRAGPPDYTAIQTRLFSMGQDLILVDYVGNMGFEEVTDWEYYYQDDEDDNNNDSSSSKRRVVQPNPMDKSKPKRTRTSSGSVVRVFRGELTGQIGGLLSAQGLDKRVLIKEFTGKLALELAQAELQSIGKLQSNIVVGNDKAAQKGEWISLASARSIKLRQDNANVAILMKALQQNTKTPFLGILGEVNLVELEENLAPNDFYKSLGVAPPKPQAVWVVYEYAGVSSTLQTYASAPPQTRRAQLPVQKGFFGNVVEPPALPSWKERANYVVRGIVKGAIEAVATLHENGLVHRSIGRSSILVSSKTQDKMEAVSCYATLISNLRVKLADFGFSGLYQDSTLDKEFCARARTFGLSFRPGENSVATANFAIAEDMHALGFVVLALLLSSLAELPRENFPMPTTDEDTLQRLLGEIFEKDMDQFREYVEAEDIWSDLVELLDENDRAGWKVLETLLLAREKAAERKDTEQIFSVRGLLSSPFFQSP